MGAAAAVLGARRLVALAALVVAVAVWTETVDVLPELQGGWDTAFAVCVLIPATLAVAWLALPLAGARWLLPAAIALLGVSIVADIAGAEGVFNAAKLSAYVAFGYWFVTLFQDELAWIVLVALLIPWVDAASVWQGPTNVVVEDHPDVFTRIAIGFPLPGGTSGANLGPPDVVFLALFLAAASRFRLRVGATFVATMALLGATLTTTTVLDIDGLPALPAVSLGFLLPNADLLWRRRPRRRQERVTPAGRQG